MEQEIPFIRGTFHYRNGLAHKDLDQHSLYDVVQHIAEEYAREPRFGCLNVKALETFLKTPAKMEFNHYRSFQRATVNYFGSSLYYNDPVLNDFCCAVYDDALLESYAGTDFENTAKVVLYFSASFPKNISDVTARVLFEYEHSKNNVRSYCLDE